MVNRGKMATDVIVIGMGAMGSAAAPHLAEKGHRVLAFDRFAPPHSRGSSHGVSRVFRQAYFEDPRYVRPLLRARELWTRLERDTGRQLLRVTGVLIIGPNDGQPVARSAESARQFHIPHEIVSASELKRRWPAFRGEADTVALLEHYAGYLVPEFCTEQQLAQAALAGARLHCNEPVLGWSAPAGNGVRVRMERGTYAAERLVIAAGPWALQVLSRTDLPLRVTRLVACWFEPRERLAFRNKTT